MNQSNIEGTEGAAKDCLSVRRNKRPTHENYIEMSLSRLCTCIKQGREMGEKHYPGNVINAIFYCIEKQFEDLNCAVISYLPEIPQVPLTHERNQCEPHTDDETS